MLNNNTAKIVRLHFKCRDLADMDTFSKSDPYVVLYSVDGKSSSARNAQHSFIANTVQPRRTFGGGNAAAAAASNRNKPPSSSAARPSTVGAVSAYGREIGRTEIIMNDLNPVFRQTIEMQFLFEVRQDLRVVVFDDDGYTDDDKNDVCGHVSFQLSHVICSANGKKEFPLMTADGFQKGFVEISFSERSSNIRDTVRIGFSGSGLPSGGLCSGCCPYFTLSRAGPNGSSELIYRSEALPNNTNPRWRPIDKLSLHRIIGASEDDAVIIFELFDHGSFFGDTSLGFYRCSLSQLQNANRSRLAFAPRKPSAPSKRFGDINVETLSIERFPTFASSLASGWQISMVLSIDFTGSNGDPRDYQSLHFMNPTAPNQYVSAMMSVGDILMEYDTDKQIPVYGFGANINGFTSHFFNVNGLKDPNVLGVQGALDAYGAFLPTAVLSGPTNFAPTIRAVTRSAREVEHRRIYTILLIITDGEITDMRDTINALVEADDAPLSIVIVGVGNDCDFKMMDELDGDDTNLVASSGRISRRDLVQFVPYRDFTPPKPREALAAEVLREIPDQFEEYLMLSKR